MDIKRTLTGTAIALAAAATLVAATNGPAPDTSPAGMVSFFDRNCPSGWTDVSSNWRGRYIVIGDRIGATVGTALSSGENRPTGDHVHGAPVSFYGGACPTNPTGNCVRWADAGAGRAPRDAGPAKPINVDETIVQGTNAPYVTLKACVKK